MGQIEAVRKLRHAGDPPAETPLAATHKPQSPRIPEYAAAIAIFVASRVIVFLAILFSIRFIPTNHVLSAVADDSSIWHHLLRWDSNWYLAIARGGYHYVPDSSVQQSVAFFPLYPALTWCVASIFRVRFSTAALLVSNSASVAAIALLYCYVRGQYGPRIGYTAVALFGFFPASIFLSAGYAESLAMALIMAAFLELRRGQCLRASVWCGLLTATRPTGVVMLAPLAYGLWPRPRWTRAGVIRMLAGLGIGGSGLAALAIYLGLKFGAPLAFVTSENAWNSGAHWSITTGIDAFAGLAELFRGIPLPSTLDPWVFVGFAAVIFAMRSRLSIPELLFAGTSFLLLAATRLCDGHAFWSMGREMIVIFPAYIAAAQLFEQRQRLTVGLCILMGIGLFWYTALFAQLHWVD
ncbi:MAG: mannosyltransferase family protein [Candidatus Binataceae bacterium]